MKKLFSPWRSQYIESFSKDKVENDKCIFCTAYQDNDDEKHFIITRGKANFVVLNIYPYNSGHLMIVPYRHFSRFDEMTDEESLEIMELIKKMINALQKVSNPDGFNIGSNIGRSAGAGIDQHIHFHLVPRWNGDTNFMPVLSDTKLISEDMKTIWEKIRSVL